MNVSLTPAQCRSVIAWLALAAILTGAWLWGSGCEGYCEKFESDSYLLQLATEEAANLEAENVKDGVKAPAQIHIQWNDYQSQVWAGSTGVIEIHCKHRGNEEDTRLVIRHELVHLMWATADEAFVLLKQVRP